MALSENKQKMTRGELYFAFTPELMQERKRSKDASHQFNIAGAVSRRRRVELWRNLVGDLRPMPPRLPTQEADDALFDDEPWVEPPIQMDYGTNVKVASNVFMNVNCVFLDTCITSIGSRTLVGPNVSFFSGTHPLDPELRDGTAGPETGKEIHVEEDCWIGGNAMILPGVRVGRGASIGAGSVVTKDVAPFTCVAGNPARLLRKIKTNMDPSQSLNGSKDNAPLEKPMAELATKLEEKEL